MKQTENSSSKFLFLFLDLVQSLVASFILSDSRCWDCRGQTQWLIVVFHCIYPQLGVLRENENTSALCYYKSTSNREKKGVKLAKGANDLGFFGNASKRKRSKISDKIFGIVDKRKQKEGQGEHCCRNLSPWRFVFDVYT